jgi:hypothetical protein
MVQNSSNAYANLTPVEEEVLSKFGDNMLFILKKALKIWAEAMLAKVAEDPGFRPIRELEHVDLIMEYLKVFQKAYEDRYGKMESGKPSSAFGEIKDHIVFIKSTCYGVKVVLGLLMADRMHVVERKRKLERAIIGFMEVEVEDLEGDGKDCPICQDPMGVESPEGTVEIPLRLVICCGQVIGGRCLRAWLGELMYHDTCRNNCPTCRFKFPKSFLENLFSKDEYAARIEKERDDVVLVTQRDGIELVSPTPEPVEMMRAQLEQETLLQQQLHDETESMEVELARELISPSAWPLSPPVRAAQMRRTNGPTVPERHQQHSMPLRQVQFGELAEGEVMEDDFDMEG